MDYRTQQMNDIWTWGMAIIFMGLMFGMVRELLTGTVEKPALLPQTKVVTVTCPICGKVIEIPGYNAITRSEALRRHIEEKHSGKVTGTRTTMLTRGISQEIPLGQDKPDGKVYIEWARRQRTIYPPLIAQEFWSEDVHVRFVYGTDRLIIPWKDAPQYAKKVREILRNRGIEVHVHGY